MEQSALEAWQVTGALGCSTKSWGSVLDAILVAQGFMLLGTLQGNIEAAQTDNGTSYWTKESPKMLPFVGRVCKPSSVKLGSLCQGGSVCTTHSTP